jgi:hypothetical protein
MRRFFALLLVTPLVASCSDSVAPVAPSDSTLGLEVSPVEASQLGAWVVDESPLQDWTLEEWTAGQSAPESPLQVGAATDAVMFFGDPNAGSHFGPPGSHDQSFIARDKIVPGTVVIDVNQKVTFNMYPGHRVAIYKPGVRPEDIIVNPASFFVLDPTNRQAIQGIPVPSLYYKFTQPGRYLVICAITRHFVDAKMYGWVIVR